MLFLIVFILKTMEKINNNRKIKQEEQMKTEQTMKVNLTLDQEFYDKIKLQADGRHLKVATYIKQQLRYMMADEVPAGTTDSEHSDDNLISKKLNHGK